ncbi:N-acetyltransferase family protein [Primorskyibacter sp. S87]|uniref:GNAT family N-acetyltransferase n=1 Tax=Primorskyibacter sp. S87 TaxID=3415126 RepID=UPI003C7E8129
MIRPAQAGDAKAIADFWNPQIRETMITFSSVEKTPEEIALMIDHRPIFLVAELEGQVVGFATYRQFRGGIGYARTMEHTVILAPSARQRGLGRALMREIEAHAKAAGAHTMIAGVSSGNQDARAFHAALGYDYVVILPEVGQKFEKWWDLVLMQKFLSPRVSEGADIGNSSG